jgi:hypothetical protein
VDSLYGRLGLVAVVVVAAMVITTTGTISICIGGGVPTRNETCGAAIGILGRDKIDT